MDFFGIGLPEIIFILLIAFVIFGPKRIVEISRSAGNVMRNLSKDASQIQNALSKEIDGEKPGGTGAENKPSGQVKP